jgi:hypothetical protein
MMVNIKRAKSFLGLALFLSCRQQNHSVTAPEPEPQSITETHKPTLPKEKIQNSDLCEKIQAAIKRRYAAPSSPPPAVESIQSADCNLWVDFTHSEEFDQLFLKAPPAATTLPTQDSPTPQDSSSLLSDSVMEKALLTLSLIGFASAAKAHFVDGRSKKAFFAILVSSSAAYFSYELSTDQISETERDMIPWVIFLSGIMSLMGAAEALPKGYKLWTEDIKERDPSWKKPTTILDKLKTVFSFDDQALHHISDKAKANGVQIEALTIKKIAGGATLATGGVLGFLALQKFWNSGKEIKKQLSLTGDDPDSFQNIEAEFGVWLGQRAAVDL